MSNVQEYFRLSLFLGEQRKTFPFNITDALARDERFANSYRRMTEADCSTIMIPIDSYTRELHERVLELFGESKVLNAMHGESLFIEHFVKDKDGFRATSETKIDLKKLKTIGLPKEEVPTPGLVQRFFSSNWGFATTLALIGAGMGLVQWGALKERQALQQQSPEVTAAATNPEITNQAETSKK